MLIALPRLAWVRSLPIARAALLTLLVGPWIWCCP